VLIAVGLLLATLIAYYPAWHGGLVWDDDGHLTRVALRSVNGLARIWFDLGATQQYYPVVHSVFWVQHRLWGDSTLGYHLVNILLHVCAAVLFVVVLTRLKVPGAWLAGVVFALHPVQVESVAWITETKNTLSTVFYLGAALAYLRFDSERSTRAYAGALVLFGLALFSKTVTATLPAALLVIFWWRRGTVQWRRDVVPLLPFAAFGIGAGLLTVWVERTQIGARGADFDFTFLERGLIAGRAIWFYATSLVWPARLVFVYPRWPVSQSVWWQYLFPAGVLLVAAVLWRLRGRSRAPLAALLLFCGTLFPALGFVDVYPFRFSFVADHFQYLASLGVIAAAAAAGAGLLARLKAQDRGVPIVALVVGTLLAALTWRQSAQYADAETLYRTTIARNPACWLAYNNLGAARLRSGTPDDVQEAVSLIRRSLQINARNAEAQNNLGFALQALGRLDEALVAYREAIRLSPDFAEAYGNLGAALTGTGRLRDAVEAGRRALRLRPDLGELHASLGDTWQAMGRVDEAVAEYREALRLDGGLPRAHSGLGNALAKTGRLQEALEQLDTAVALNPRLADAHDSLGLALQAAGRIDDAIGQHAEAIRLRPTSVSAHYNLARAFQRIGRLSQAIVEYTEAVRLEPDFAAAHCDLGSALVSAGRLPDAIVCYRTAIRLDPSSALAHDNVGIALARDGRPAEALQAFLEALRLKPDDAAAHCGSGNVLLAMGRVTEAIAHYREALALDPASAEAHNNLGVALQQAGRPGEALAEFEHAVRIDPAFGNARANLARARATRAARRPPVG
jgi:tetratricopeptide (TPR) repeat protein